MSLNHWTRQTHRWLSNVFTRFDATGLSEG